jgi:threonine/homoserine/homoserine lactone efflux protein
MNGRMTTVILVLVFLALIVGGALLVEGHAPKFIYQQVPGYKGWIGFLGAVVFIVVGKRIGKHFLQRPEQRDGS